MPLVDVGSDKTLLSVIKTAAGDDVTILAQRIAYLMAVRIIKGGGSPFDAARLAKALITQCRERQNANRTQPSA